MGHHLAPPMDLAVETIPQVNTVHLQQDPTDLVVLLPLSTELHQILLDLVVPLLTSTVLLRAQADSEALHLLPDMVPLHHQTDLVMVVHLPDIVLLQPQADSVVVLLLQNMVFLHLQADLVVRPSIAVVTLQVPRDLVAHLRISTALLQLSVAMVVLHHHSTLPLLLWDDLEVPLRINTELLHLAAMVALLLPNSGLIRQTVDSVALLPPSMELLQRTVDSVALLPPSIELLQRTVDSVALLPPSTERHPLKTDSVELLRLSMAPLHPSVVLPLLNMVHHLTVGLAAYPLPDTVLLPVPTDLEVVTEHLDHTLQMVDTTTLEDAMDSSMMTYL